MATNHDKSLILCGIAGGVSVYKTVDAVSRLHKSEHEVRVVMTPSAQQFVAPLSFQAVLGKAVGTEFFCSSTAQKKEQLYPHLYPAGEADLYIVMPATADTISKIANARADDLVCASALGLSPDCIKVFCPAMNTNMWQQPAVQENVKTLLERGWIQIGPEKGVLACGTMGDGRMAEPETIAIRINELVKKKANLIGRQIVILSGPTREHIDPVRYIGNASSGKMGKALAEEAAQRGASVTFITGPVPPEHLPHHAKIETRHITSAQQLLEEAHMHVEGSDAIIFAAAVADVTPATSCDHKLAKDQIDLTIALQPTPDIAATLTSNKKSNQQMIGFALQDQQAEENARRKLNSKKFDAIILNSLDAMGADQATYQCLTTSSDNFDNWGRLTKTKCAQRILNLVEQRLHNEKDLLFEG